MKEKTLEVIAWILVIVLVCSISFGIYYTIYAPSEQMKDFCISKGFITATDFKDYRVANKDYDYRLLCDEEKIFNVIRKLNCTERNIWDECIRGKNVLIELSNVTYEQGKQ